MVCSHKTLRLENLCVYALYATTTFPTEKAIYHRHEDGCIKAQCTRGIQALTANKFHKKCAVKNTCIHLNSVFSSLFRLSAKRTALVALCKRKTRRLWNFKKLLAYLTSLTHWGRDEMNNISQTTFSNAFSSMKMFEFRLKFHWSLFPRVPINNIPALVQILAWRRSGDKPLSEPMMVSLPMHIRVTRPQWVKRHGFKCYWCIFRMLVLYSSPLLHPSLNIEARLFAKR